MKTTITISLAFTLLAGLIPNVFAKRGLTTTQTPKSKIVIGDANDFPKCLGIVNDGCRHILLADGTAIENPGDITVYTTKASYYPPGGQYALSPEISEELGGDEQTDGGGQIEDAVGEADGGGGSGDNPRDDPDCWYYDHFVCDESGECDSDNFDCITDCDDGNDVTTGEPCSDGEQGDESGEETEDAAEEIEVYGVESFEGGDSQETATDEREYDPEGDIICGNDETGEE